MFDNYPEFSDSSTTTMNSQIKIYTGRPTEGNECHPAAFTMEECEAVRQAIGAPVFKNLFLTNKQ